VRGLSVTARPNCANRVGCGREDSLEYLDGGDVDASGTAGHTFAMLASEMSAKSNACPAARRFSSICGANVASFRVRFSYGEPREWVAFEPSPGNADCPPQNLAREWPTEDCRLSKGRLESRHGLIVINSENALNPGVTTFRSARGEHSDSKVTSIDACAPMWIWTGWTHQMDVEGAELHALKGALSNHAGLCVALVRCHGT